MSGQVTLLSDVTSHVLPLVMGRALKALEGHTGLAPLLHNSSSIDGNSPIRRIPLQDNVVEAVPDSEAAAFTAYQKHGFKSPVDVTPTGYAAGFNPSVKSLRSRMGMATNEQVIAALQSGTEAAVPMLIELYVDGLKALALSLERRIQALYADFTLSAGTTKEALTIARCIDARTKVLDGDPAHRAIMFHLSTRQFSDLQKEVASATTGLATVYADGVGREFLASVGGPDNMPALESGALGGSPIFVGSSKLFIEANTGEDRVGLCAPLGRGAAGEAGSMRGVIEVVEGHAPVITLAYDDAGNFGRCIARQEVTPAIFDDMACKIVSDK